MNKNLTEIAFILDRSGSMQSIAAAAIAGFNHFLKSQQSAPGNARLTLVLFDDEYLVPQASVPVVEVRPLTRETSVPRNSTALLDAIGRTINELGQRLAAMPEPERPSKVIVAILTDGDENASTQFSWTQIAERIRHQTQNYQWDFFFLGANQDAIATAAKMSIAPQNAATYVGDSLGQFSGSAALTRKANAVRSKAAGKMTPEESADDAMSLSEMVREEDTKHRGDRKYHFSLDRARQHGGFPQYAQRFRIRSKMKNQNHTIQSMKTKLNLRTHAAYTGPDLDRLRAGGHTIIRLDVEALTVERAQRLVDRDHATVETEESACIQTFLDELCDGLLFAHGLDDDTTTVHYAPSEQAFFSVQDGSVSA